MARLTWIAITLLAFGCGRKDDIRRYKAPKDPAWRTLAAIAVGKEATWFFKVFGPADHVASNRNEFLELLKTIRAEEGQIRWTAPAGWQEESGGRYRFGKDDPRLEMTVVRLAGAAGGTLANVNRWREQLGLDPVTDPSTQLRKVEGAAVEVLLMDLVGPKRPPRAMKEPAPAPSGEVSLDRVRSLFSFDLPVGWKETPQPQQGRIFEFHAGDALVTLSLLSGESGGVVANVNRWRGQAGLDPLSDELTRASTHAFPFLSPEGWIVDMVGKDRTIVCAFVLSSEFSIFLKMDGPPGAVSEQRVAFEGLARSFRMGGKSD
jgi:hypothetical protein